MGRVMFSLLIYMIKYEKYSTWNFNLTSHTVIHFVILLRIFNLSVLITHNGFHLGFSVYSPWLSKLSISLAMKTYVF